VSGFADVSGLDEDARIDLIARAALGGQAASSDKPRIIGFVVDDDRGRKGDRYIRKLRERFPAIRVIDRRKGPVAGTELIRVGPPLR
jgi:hypothetical protein